MNYVSRDECQTLAGEFTCNQIERMYYQWIFYRDEVTTCPPGEMEIEFALDFDREHDEENRVFLYELRGGSRASVIFDSDIDHDDGAFDVQNILVLDICLPQNLGYELVVTDTAGNGFSRRGEIVVFQNGQLLTSENGNFGSTLSINIPAIAETTPSPVTNRPTAAPITPTAQPTDRPTSQPTASPIQDTIEQTPVTTAAPSAIFVGRTNPPTMSSNLVDTAEPTIVRTQPPKQPTRPPRPIKQMKMKSSGSMKKLGKSISHSSMLMKLKSKSDTLKSKKKSPTKSSMNMKKEDRLSKKSKVSKGSESFKGATHDATHAPVPSRTSGTWNRGDIFGH